MPTVAQCSKCQRTYMVVGPHARTLMAGWTCPRCKRGRNLPHESAPESHPFVRVSPGATARR